jgi:hypothetical protein
MAEIYGTSGPDTVTVENGDWYHGLEGDDQITIGRGTGEGNQGNDTIAVLPGLELWESTIWYWGSPATIYVDLHAGFALDGYGTRDTLINVHNVHGFQRNGDQGYGTDDADAFWAGANYNTNIQSGTITIDGRGGHDNATIGPNWDDIARLGELVVSVSVDHRSFNAYFQNCPGFVYHFRNIEYFEIWNGVTQTRTVYDLPSYTDYTRAGQDLLLRGAVGWQSAAPGSAVTVTYSFPTAAPATGGEGGTGFSAFNAAQQEAVRGIFWLLQQQTHITFQEVSGDAGQIRFAINEQTATRGYAFAPDEYRNDARAGDVWLDVQTAQVIQQGQEGYYVLLHEIGHALGLQHTLAPSDTSGAVVLLDSLNTFANTIMPDEASNTTVWPTWFGSFDMQALRYLYGSRAYSSGDDTYQISAANIAQNLSILDDAGTDTLDVSQTRVSANIDLRPGHVSSAGQDADGIANVNNIGISSTSLIENVWATSGDDLLTGNDANNTFVLNGGNDIVDGQAGLDIAVFNYSSAAATITAAITADTWNVESTIGRGSVQLTGVERLQFTDATVVLTNAGNESLTGSTGIDTVAYPGAWATYTVSKTGTGYTVTDRVGSGGTDTLTSIERVYFTDKHVALDVSPTGNAAQSLMFIGSIAYGLKNNPDVIGTVMYFFDQGMSMQQVCQIAVDAQLISALAGSSSNADLARLIWRNVIGTEPDSGSVDLLLSFMDGRNAAFSQAQLLATVAQLDLNQQHVGLVGLANSGLEYLPFAG